MLVRIALFDDGDRNAVCAEDDLGATGISEAAERFFDFFDEGFEIEMIAVERFHGMNREVFAIETAPFVQAAAGSGAGEVRIKRQENNFIATGRLELRDGFHGKGMPVAHGDKAAGINAGSVEPGLKRARLLLGKAPDGRTAADHRVVMLHFAGAGSGDELGEGFAPNTREREINDIRVAK